MSTPELWVVRHAETDWAVSGRHTSTTEVSLNDAGRAAARALEPVLARHEFALVLSSPRARGRETAALAGFPDAEVEPNLAEWDYGEFEGLTTVQIRARGRDWARWRVFTDPVPGGESLEQVATRADAVLARVDQAQGDVLCFTHGHMGRVLTAVALGVAPEFGEHLALDPACLGVVGHERESRVLRLWNLHP